MEIAVSVRIPTAGCIEVILAWLKRLFGHPSGCISPGKVTIDSVFGIPYPEKQEEKRKDSLVSSLIAAHLHHYVPGP